LMQLQEKQHWRRRQLLRPWKRQRTQQKRHPCWHSRQRLQLLLQRPRGLMPTERWQRTRRRRRGRPRPPPLRGSTLQRPPPNEEALVTTTPWRSTMAVTTTAATVTVIVTIMVALPRQCRSPSSCLLRWATTPRLGHRRRRRPCHRLGKRRAALHRCRSRRCHFRSRLRRLCLTLPVGRGHKRRRSLTWHPCLHPWAPR